MSLSAGRRELLRERHDRRAWKAGKGCWLAEPTTGQTRKILFRPTRLPALSTILECKKEAGAGSSRAQREV